MVQRKVRVFDKEYSCSHYEWYTIKDLSSRTDEFARDCLDLFGYFSKLFTDHPDENNTRVYILHYDEERKPALLWTCSHFEHNTSTDITALAYFLALLEEYFGASAFLDLLDAFTERLIIWVPGIDID